MFKLGENCLKVDFQKNNPEKSEKTVFLAFFDILVKFTLEGQFQPKNAKNQVFVIFKLKASRNMSITRESLEFVFSAF